MQRTSASAISATLRLSTLKADQRLSTIALVSDYRLSTIERLSPARPGAGRGPCLPRRPAAPGPPSPRRTVAYKVPAGILAACAGPYGRKNTRGKYPRAFYFVIFNNSARIASGSSNTKIINILFSPLPDIIVIYKFGY